MPRKPSSGKDKLFAHAVLFVACVVFPAIVTAIAPVSWVVLTRYGDQVEARVKVCLIFIIPFHTESLLEVRSVDNHVRPGVCEKLGIGDADDQRREITTESEGMLVLQGTDRDVVVQVSPASLDRITRGTREFLEDKNLGELRFFAPANWKVSVIVGGLLCLLTLLYVFVVVTGVWHSLRKKPSAT